MYDSYLADGFMKAISQGRLVEFQRNLNLLQIKEVEIEEMIEYVLDYVFKCCTSLNSSYVQVLTQLRR
jgi:hypothetical protein